MNYASYIRIFIIIIAFSLALVSISALILINKAIDINVEIIKFSLEMDGEIISKSLLTSGEVNISTFRPYFDLISFSPEITDTSNLYTETVELFNGDKLVLGRKYPYIEKLKRFRNILTVSFIIISIFEIIIIYFLTKEKIMKPFEVMSQITGGQATPDGVTSKLEELVIELKKNKGELELLYKNEKDKVIKITERTKSVFESLRVGVLDINKQGIIKNVNSEFIQLLENENIKIGSPAKNVLKNKDIIETIDFGLKKNIYRNLKIELGSKIIETIVSPVYEKNETSGISIACYDITDIVFFEKVLMTKEKFISIGEMSSGIAHEFRNSASVLLGVSKLLEKKYDDDNIKMLTQEIDSLVQTVEKFQLLTKENKVDFSNFDILLLLNNIKETYNWDLTLNIKEKIFKGDKGLIKSVLINIIKNSIEHGSLQKDVVISTEVNNQMYKIEIVDKGKGISKENIERVKAPFYTTKEEGVGLGLSIVERIMELHEGTLEFIQQKKGVKAIIKWKKKY